MTTIITHVSRSTFIRQHNARGYTVAKCEGGFIIFESRADYITWKCRR